MFAELEIIMRDQALSWEFWNSMLVPLAVALISWGFVIVITILETVRDFKNS